jgi:acyl dehydratase
MAITPHALAAGLLLAEPPDEGIVSWSGRDAAIYNLGIGFGAAAAGDERFLPYVLEEKAAAFPTMVSVLEAKTASLFVPRFGIDIASILHGEEAIELHRPIAGAGTVRAVRRVEAIWDKGAGRAAVMLVRRDLFDATTRAPVATVRSTLMLRNKGGFGGSNDGAPQPSISPDRAPNGVVDIATLPEQALLYRLAGDRNPLHVDPDVARRAGFPKPILMGLCSFGIAGRALVAALADGDADRLTALKVRFTGVVFPGETLRIEHWRLDDGEIAFRGSVAERGAVVLDGGRARISA